MHAFIFSLILLFSIPTAHSAVDQKTPPPQMDFEKIWAEIERIQKLLENDVDIAKVSLEDKKTMLQILMQKKIAETTKALQGNLEKDIEKKLEATFKDKKATKETITVVQEFVDVFLSKTVEAHEKAWPEIAKDLTKKFKLSDEKKDTFMAMKDDYIQTVKENNSFIKAFMTVMMLDPKSPENSEIKSDLETLHAELKKQKVPSKPADIKEVINKILTD